MLRLGLQSEAWQVNGNAGGIKVFEKWPFFSFDINYPVLGKAEIPFSRDSTLFQPGKKGKQVIHSNAWGLINIYRIVEGCQEKIPHKMRIARGQICPDYFCKEIGET